ncbi:metallophosphoesterase [Paenibacillus algorifonticola]|uniref:metallophosphoesterase n=1 Tax=Paenibacillus algorifonticola TaxID=684063 RepID=UPI003D2DA462
MRKPLKRVGIFIAAVAAIIGFLYFQNNALTLTSFQLSSAKLPQGLKDFTIVQLSDVHGKRFGDHQQRLVRKVENQQPNIIVVTGDLIDSRRGGEAESLELMAEIVKLAPVYYVTGNHEYAYARYPELEKKLLELGVHVLRNEAESIPIESSNGTGTGEIRLLGIDDPKFSSFAGHDAEAAEQNIQTATEDFSNIAGKEKAGAATKAEAGKQTEEGLYTILLSHRPERFDVYVRAGIDLTFSGHAHGGQVRLPFIGGLVAPGQGLLPVYDAGQYVNGPTNMLVSRGLGNSVVPQRLFNRPDIVVVKLSAAS